MVFVFHLVVHAEILNFISQNNNIGFVYMAKVMSNPSLSLNTDCICLDISLNKSWDHQILAAYTIPNR